MNDMDEIKLNKFTLHVDSFNSDKFKFENDDENHLSLNIYEDIHLNKIETKDEIKNKNFIERFKSSVDDKNKDDKTPEFKMSLDTIQKSISSSIDDSNMWSSSIEEEITNFASICEEEANEQKNKAKNQSRIGRSLQISLIILGSISVYSSASSLELDIKNSISLITGFSTTVISSIYTMFGFTKKSTITYETSIGLESIARMIRCELLKPKNKRVSPFDLIYYANVARDKLIKRKTNL